MKTVMPEIGDDLMKLSIQCGALYICPKMDGERKGPLVVYTGKDSKGKNLVGDIYFNFRKIEQHTWVVKAFALEAFKKLNQLYISDFDTICGIPEGGRSFGQMLAYVTDKRFVYPTKVPKKTQEGLKQEYTWDLSQFTFEEGERVLIAEDVFNNFQNTDTTLDLVQKSGAEVVLLVGALNRSPFYSTHYRPKTGHYIGASIPLVASIREPYPEYEQDDPEVAEHIKAGHLEYEVKKNWDKLQSIMCDYNTLGR